MHKQITFAFLSAALAVSLAACGDDDGGANPDASVAADAADLVDAPPVVDAALAPDAFMFESMPSCDEFTTPAMTLSTFPATFTGNIMAAAANVDVSDCTAANAPFGIQAAGPEQVIKLTGLTPGGTYFARTDSPGDLAVYVVTGCAGGTTTTAQCLNFADGTLEGIESAAFVAPAGGEAFVVVDYWDAASEPDSYAYTLTVDQNGCSDDLGCLAANPVCNRNSNTCTVFNSCTGDDTAAEAQSDDGPSGATVLAPVIGTPLVTTAATCNDATGNDGDWYKITTVVGDKLTASLEWADAAADMDIYAFDAELNLIGQSWWEKPEPLALSFLPAGTTYLRVERFAPNDDPVATPYTLTLTRTAPALCTTVADCATDFRNQRFRASCTTGACVFLDANNTVAQGGLCDSTDDCVGDPSNTICTSFLYTANLDTHGKCSGICTTDAECQAYMGADGRCATGGAVNYCHVKCTANNECESRINAMPLAGQPWKFATCNVGTGACNIAP